MDHNGQALVLFLLPLFDSCFSFSPISKGQGIALQQESMVSALARSAHMLDILGPLMGSKETGKLWMGLVSTGPMGLRVTYWPRSN